MAKKTAGLSNLSDEQRVRVFDLAEEYFHFLHDQDPSVLQDWQQAIQENPCQTAEIIQIKQFQNRCGSKEEKQVLFRLAEALFTTTVNPEIAEDDPRVALS